MCEQLILPLILACNQNLVGLFYSVQSSIEHHLYTVNIQLVQLHIPDVRIVTIISLSSNSHGTVVYVPFISSWSNSQWKTDCDWVYQL